MKTSNNTPLNAALGLPTILEPNAVERLEETLVDDKARTDFNFVRSNIRVVIEDSIGAIGELSAIAQASQHPRAYEVLARLMEVASAANKDLMQVHKDIHDIETSSGIEPGNKKVTNNLFIGSTAELKTMLDKIQKPAQENES